jgi:hypothetical protein
MGRIVGLRVTVREGQLCGGGNGPSDPLRPPHPRGRDGRRAPTCCGPLLLLKVCALAHQFPSQSFRARTSSMLWMASATAASFPGAKVRSVDRDMRGKSARVA